MGVLDHLDQGLMNELERAEMMLVGISIVLMVLLVLAGLLPATASQVHFIPLEKDVQKIKSVLRVKVTDVERGQTHMKLEDGTDGHITSSHITVSGDVLEVIWGKCSLKKIESKYTWIVPIKCDNKGQEILSFSPIISGSGLENDIEKGKEYLFSYSYVLPHKEKGKQSVLYHMRTDPISTKARIMKLLKEANNKIGLSKTPDAGNGK